MATWATVCLRLCFRQASHSRKRLHLTESYPQCDNLWQNWQWIEVEAPSTRYNSINRRHWPNLAEWHNNQALKAMLLTSKAWISEWINAHEASQSSSKKRSPEQLWEGHSSLWPHTYSACLSIFRPSTWSLRQNLDCASFAAGRIGYSGVASALIPGKPGIGKHYCIVAGKAGMRDERAKDLIKS
jgi:hypothetical protein